MPQPTDCSGHPGTSLDGVGNFRQKGPYGVGYFGSDTRIQICG